MLVSIIRFVVQIIEERKTSVDRNLVSDWYAQDVPYISPTSMKRLKIHHKSRLR